MNKLAEYNERLTTSLRAYRESLTADQHARNAARPREASPLTALKNEISRVLVAEIGGPEGEPEIQSIDRQKFGGDLVLKFPKLLAKGGPKVFNETYRDRILAAMQSQFPKTVMADIITKGMYLNLTLADAWLVKAAKYVANSSEIYGLTRDLADDSVVIDYSSPNVAKTLHAGHIRSTIIGHVLGNVYEAAGAAVYRVNHINDFGGFGFLLEGYRRFQFPENLKNHEKLTEIYHIRRTLERVVEHKLDAAAADGRERAILGRYFPMAKTADELAAVGREFTQKSDARFAALETGDAAEVELWAQMVDWSMTDFGSFYDSLGLSIPLVIGESFYFEAADRLIDQLIQTQRAVVYTDALADRDVATLDAQLTEAEREKAVEGIRKDVGATVIPLAPHRRLVVRRKDGLSIYATRDVGAVKRRMDLFDPTKMVYVVGQEQKEHFARVFEAARAVDLLGGKDVELLHLYFGFYVDANTGKKLSSRASAAGVTDLLKGSFEYFKNKLDADVPAEDLDRTAQQLSVGSIVFNELKQDIRGSVEIDSNNLRSTIEGFEKSGGAYVVYATCRARSILRKIHAQGLPTPELTEAAAPTAEEAGVILKLLEIPERVTSAARQANPTILVRHLAELAQIYSAYYTRARVLEDGRVHLFRLLMTRAVMVGLMRGLSICHIECPERI